MPECDFCGVQAPSSPAGDGPDTSDGEDSPLPLTWVTSIENGRLKVYCDRCSREHLRALEAKLDSEWW